MTQILTYQLNQFKGEAGQTDLPAHPSGLPGFLSACQVCERSISLRNSDLRTPSVNQVLGQPLRFLYQPNYYEPLTRDGRRFAMWLLHCHCRRCSGKSKEVKTEMPFETTRNTKHRGPVGIRIMNLAYGLIFWTASFGFDCAAASSQGSSNLNL